MVVRRERKVRRQRGSRLYGWGTIGQHRKSGMRGGFGNAGLHKHKWSWMINEDPDHFGKHGFIRHSGTTNQIQAINVGELSDLIQGKVLEKDEKGKGVLDLSSYGFDKLLGAGKIDFPITVKATYFTERAKQKLEEAGGEAIKAE
jgi:large subunit ribosomal protein L15